MRDDDKFINWVFIGALILTIAFWGLVIWGIFEGIMWIRRN